MELKTQQRYSVTLRDDDVYELTDSTKYFLDLVYPEPLLLAVIPKNLDIKLVAWIKQFDNIAIAQHGWDHINRGDRYERATDEQLSWGKLMLQSAFGEKFKNIFVCRKCKCKIRAPNMKVLAGKIKCRKCNTSELRVKRKK